MIYKRTPFVRSSLWISSVNVLYSDLNLWFILSLNNKNESEKTKDGRKVVTTSPFTVTKELHKGKRLSRNSGLGFTTTLSLHGSGSTLQVRE